MYIRGVAGSWESGEKKEDFKRKLSNKEIEYVISFLLLAELEKKKYSLFLLGRGEFIRKRFELV